MNLSRCIDCHSFDQLFSHPVGVTPPASMSVPANLPLTNGRVTCVTCHADSIVDHAVDRSTGRQADIGQHDMIETGISLCAQCHDASSTSAQDLHALTIGRAHLPQSSLAKNASFSPGSPSMEWLDSESDLCMTCHDGALASSSGTDSGMRLGSSILATRPSEHPIGSYEYSDHLNPDGELTPLSMLDDRIRLFGNQVGCGSCHSMYSNERELLVMSNEGSQLCLSCHEY